MYRNLVLLTALFSVTAAASGCQGEPKPEVAANEAPAVPVSLPLQRYVTDFVDFTGRTDAVQSVDVRPRVTGYLVRIPYKEGSEVRAGDLLFEIDPRPYVAQLDQAQSQVTLNEASLKLARTTLERDRAVAILTPGGVAQQQLDEDRAAVEEAIARVKAAQASTEVYKLNLSFTKVTASIDGQISRYYLTLGNLVNQDQTLLTTVVSLDPMHAYFDMDEPTLLRIRKAINDGTIKRPPNGEFPVLMGLQGEEGFPHQGSINFFNNQVNPTTGSISVRGVFANPKPLRAEAAAAVLGLMTPGAAMPAAPQAAASAAVAVSGVSGVGGERLLSPGMFVRVRFPFGQPHEALLVIDRAIASDQGLKYVYVLDKENKAQYRRITTGPLQEDGLRVISEGLQPDDWVVVGGLQQVRPRMEVRPEQTAMPSLGRAPGAEGAPAEAPKPVRQPAKKARP
jgi:multidrug efflux system membrane fusion protein